MNASLERRALLGALALSAGCVVGLSLLAQASAPLIAARQAQTEAAQLAVVLGSLAVDTPSADDRLALLPPGWRQPVIVRRRYRAGEPVALICDWVTPEGYNGDIRLLMAMDANARVLGVRVLEHRETPGLGDFIDARRSPWISGFAGLDLHQPPAAQWALRRDGGAFDGFTGASISPRAVVDAIHDLLQQHSALWAQAFAGDAAEPS